jgi:hypothetical protein
LAAESAHVRHIHHIGERSPAAGGERSSDREPLLRAASSLGRPGRRGVAGSRCRGRAEVRRSRPARVVAPSKRHVGPQADQEGHRRAGPSPSPPAPGSSPHATQCVKTPRGASGSSTSSASDRASSGTFSQRSGGERSWPSQVYRVGIACAWSKALLSRAKSAISR